MRTTERTRSKLAELKEVLDGKTQLLIVIQDNPDPDSIAAAVALRKLANTLVTVQCSIAEVIHSIVSKVGTGGGHETIAGGQIPLVKGTKTEIRRLEVLIRRRFLRSIGAKGQKARRLTKERARL